MHDELDELEPIDHLLGAHLQEKLSGQLGRAAAAFEAQQQRAARARTRRAWIFASVPAAIAAALLIALAMPHSTARTGETGVANAAKPTIDETTWYRDLDAGTILVQRDGKLYPVRQIRRQMVQETDWFDPQEKARIRVTVPREHMVYVGMQPY